MNCFMLWDSPQNCFQASSSAVTTQVCRKHLRTCISCKNYFKEYKIVHAFLNPKEIFAMSSISQLKSSSELMFIMVPAKQNATYGSPCPSICLSVCLTLFLLTPYAFRETLVVICIT